MQVDRSIRLWGSRVAARSRRLVRALERLRFVEKVRAGGRLERNGAVKELREVAVRLCEASVSPGLVFGLRGWGRTDVRAGFAVRHAVKQPDQAARVADGLLIPNNGLTLPRTFVLGLCGILVPAELLVRLADREDEEQRVRRARNESEELWLIDAEDIVEGEFRGQAELVHECIHHLRVVLC